MVWHVERGRKPNAVSAIKRAMTSEPLLNVTLPNEVDFELIERAFEELTAFEVESYNPINTVDLLIDED